MPPRRLIVDGYNVIRTTAPYRQMVADDLDAARAALVTDVAAYAQGDWDATIVFDGAGNSHSTGASHRTAGVEVIFSPYGIEADTVIEKLAREARSEGRHVEVVTSDAQTQWTVFGHGVVRRSSLEFAAELQLGREEYAEYGTRGIRSARLEDRIDFSVREVLERWARGLE